jgi:hypothetical protein
MESAGDARAVLPPSRHDVLMREQKCETALRGCPTIASERYRAGLRTLLDVPRFYRTL